MGMKKALSVLVLFAVLLLSANAVFAASGLSIVTVSARELNFTHGGSASVDYTVDSLNGTRGNTTIVISNQNELLAVGINVSFSRPSGIPPFPGTATITVPASLALGDYVINFAAVGSDPSVNERLLVLRVVSNIAPPTTTIPQEGYYSSFGGNDITASILIVIVVIAIAYLVLTSESNLTRLIFIGVALILIGSIVWLYGDYSTGLMQYAWGGTAAILLGTMVWIYSDIKGNIFKQLLPKKLAFTGIMLILVGTSLWLYGEYYMVGNALYVWLGALLQALGIIIWLCGDTKAGAFFRII